MLNDPPFTHALSQKVAHSTVLQHVQPSALAYLSIVCYCTLQTLQLESKSGGATAVPACLT